MSDLVFRTATELAEIIRQKTASATKVLEAHLQHIARHNPALKAIVTPAGLSSKGLPIGLQLVGRRWREMELLAVAEAVAEVTGPF